MRTGQLAVTAHSYTDRTCHFVLTNGHTMEFSFCIDEGLLALENIHIYETVVPYWVRAHYNFKSKALNAHYKQFSQFEIYQMWDAVRMFSNHMPNQGYNLRSWCLVHLGEGTFQKLQRNEVEEKLNL